MIGMRIKTIRATNVCAFRDFELELGGRHLLAWGENGTGKSSLARVLRTWLWSSTVPASSSARVSELFVRGTVPSLANIHAPKAEERFVDVGVVGSGGPEAVRRIAMGTHETAGRSDLEGVAKASDFISYRVLSDFFRTRTNDILDLWPVFEREILPLCPTVLALPITHILLLGKG